MKYLLIAVLMASLTFGSDVSSGPESFSAEIVHNQTMGERNALAKALSYLRFTSFSRTGLIGQLEYEGFSHSESVYGADHCGADWNEQAALKAESYLSFTSFSRTGLIDQLLYEGFTRSQAEYGASAVGY